MSTKINQSSFLDTLTHFKAQRRWVERSVWVSLSSLSSKDWTSPCTAAAVVMDFPEQLSFPMLMEQVLGVQQQVRIKDR